MKALLEGLLFVKGSEGLSLEEIINITKEEPEKIKNALKELYNDYQSEERGIQLELLGNRYKLTTKEIHKDIYKSLVTEEENSNLSQSALETLAIIAYNEPITRIEIDEIRGINSSHMVRKLVSRDLIEEKGRSDAPGRPILYGVTDKFLDYFSRNQVTLDEMKTAFYGFLCDNDRDKIEREAKANFEDIKYPKYNDSVEDILFNRTNKIDFENFDDNHKNQNKVKR